MDSQASEVDIALLEDKQLVELHKEKTNNNYTVGDVYLGRVKKIMPGLNAAFVDVGHEKDAFLHYLDLGPQIRSLSKYIKFAMGGKSAQLTMDNFRLESDIEKTGKITQLLATGAQILVQIAKEPISTKGPRISSEISFAGRYLVLVPFSNRISVSQKIRSSEERNRLKRIIQSIKPNNYGVIIRTIAENKKVAELDADLRMLIEKWEKTTERLHNAVAPIKITSELDRTSVILRDLLNESFNNVYVNDELLYEETKDFIRKIAPQKTDIVKLYKGKEPIFEYFGIKKQIKGLFGKTVTIKSGIYLIIEHTEAMHVIDVNSGHRVNKDNSQEQNAFTVNLEAAAEIARQLRLRDMGGIIVIDFIDMHDAKNRRELYEKFKEYMANDHARHTILPPSKFGLIQITRQRVRPTMDIKVLENCPSCDGSGKIKPSILFADEIENNLKYLLLDQNERALTIAVHPFIYAYLTKGICSIRRKWMWKYKRSLKIKPMSNYQMLEYHFFNKNNDEIKI
jgi:ribonuclease G